MDNGYPPSGTSLALSTRKLGLLSLPPNQNHRKAIGGAWWSLQATPWGDNASELVFWTREKYDKRLSFLPTYDKRSSPLPTKGGNDFLLL